MSHENPLTDKAAMDSGASRHLDVIERVTGRRPPTCPWRAMYDPLVQEVLAVMPFDENGNLAAALGPNPPALLVDAIADYKLAVGATRAEEMKKRAKAREAQRH